MAAIVLVIIGVVYYFITRKKEESFTFETVQARVGTFKNSITATGTVQPVDTVTVGSQVSGVIKNLYVDFNSVVHKGQLLATIDPSILAAQREQSLANLTNAKGNLRYQQSIYNRQKKLFKMGVISEADYQVAQNGLISAKANVNNALAQLKITTKNVFNTKIYSPIDGMILNRTISEGQTIASSFNAPTLFVIAKDLTKMLVRAAVDEADIGNVKVGQQVEFTVDAFPDDLFHGTVHQILLHAKVTANVVTYTTLIRVDNALLKLKPGMTASIAIFTYQNTQALLIPLKAIHFKPDSLLVQQGKVRYASQQSIPKNKGNVNQISSVWVQRGDELVEKKIEITKTNDLDAEVVVGLKTGDIIVTNCQKTGGNAAANNSQNSPFMPKFGNRKKAKTTKP
ncbi:MAG: efflux transporter periplasmic adaptor subunit [Flavobacterium sp. BFFFF2]|nr:MAG: efflux transporter periplasmic adaptor subunit [Flavobacterium sp. BFFFF2]